MLVECLVVALVLMFGAFCIEKMDKRYWRSRARRELADKHQAQDERHKATMALILGKPAPRRKAGRK